MRLQRKRLPRQQHGRKGKCPIKAQPVSSPSNNLISDLLTFLTSRLVPAPSVLPTDKTPWRGSPERDVHTSFVEVFIRQLLEPSEKTSRNQADSTRQKACAMAFTETWLAPEYRDSEFAVPGILLIRTDSSRSRSDGVAIYLRNELPPSLIYFDFPAQPMADTLWLQLPLRHPDALLIGLVYRSPSSDLRKDCERFKSTRDFFLSHHCSHLLLFGDFNAPDIIRNEGVSAGDFSSRLLCYVKE